MFCPRCGQQAPEEVRYCPRCGLPLTPHAVLLTGSITPPPAPSGVQSPVLTRKRINSRRAAKLIFFGIALFPVFLILAAAADAVGLLALPILTFMVGLAWWVYIKLFGDDTPVVQHTPGRDLGAGGERPALGAPQFVPASLFNQQGGNTSEIAQPRSVTENTTKLLDKDV